MTISTRASLAVGLCLIGLVSVVAPTLGQQDGAVRPTNNTQAAAAPGKPAVFGAIDLEKVIQDYQKYKDSSEKFKAEATKKKAELEAMAAEGRDAAEKMSQMKPGTPDYQKWNDKVTEIKAKLEANREQIAADFTLRESEAVATIYNDIRQMTAAVAQQRKMNFVVQVSNNEPVAGTDPNAVMAAMARNVVYYDPSADITADVTKWLNHYYEKSKQTASAPATTKTQ